MDDTGPKLAADAAEIGNVVEQRIDQRAAGVPGGGMNHHPGGFVEDDDVLVLEDDAQRQGFRLGGRGRRAEGCRSRTSDPGGPSCWRARAADGPLTLPSLISRWMCERERSGSSAVRKLSSRSPSCSSSTGSARAAVLWSSRRARTLCCRLQSGLKRRDRMNSMMMLSGTMRIDTNWEVENRPPSRADRRGRTR